MRVLEGPCELPPPCLPFSPSSPLPPHVPLLCRAYTVHLTTSHLYFQFTICIQCTCTCIPCTHALSTHMHSLPPPPHCMHRDSHFPRLGQMIVEYDHPIRKMAEEFSPLSKVMFAYHPRHKLTCTHPHLPFLTQFPSLSIPSHTHSCPSHIKYTFVIVSIPPRLSACAND